MRQCIERAFGLLTQRWGVFWRPLKIQFNKWSLVCTVAAKLHNFCIDQRIGMADQRHADDIMPGDSWNVHENTEESEEILRPSGTRRNDLTNRLMIRGAVRPPHSQCNSKI
jgi:hypothetical protein